MVSKRKFTNRDEWMDGKMDREENGLVSFGNIYVKDKAKHTTQISS